MKRLVVVLLLVAACRTTTMPPRLDPEDIAEKRERWFFQQRAYPFDSIPADARRKAFEAVHRAETSITGDAAFAPYWRAVGPEPVQVFWPWRFATGRVKALAICPADPNLILAGSSSGGIWRSLDAGEHFTPVSDNQADLAVGDIAFSPSNPNIVYAAMGSDFLGTGVLRSDDAGAHWHVVSGDTFGPRGTSPNILIDPTNPNRLWVAQYSRLDEASGSSFSSGVLRSTDGGVTWTTQLDGLTADLTALTNNSEVLLAGMVRNDSAGGGDAGIYRSTNGGLTWSNVVDAGSGSYAFPRVAVTPASPQRVYAQMFSYGPGGEKYRFLVSDNGGITWNDAPAIGLPREFSVFVAADPSNAQIVYVGMRDLYKSTDSGATFTNQTRGYNAAGNFDPELSASHVDQHALAFHPQHSSTLYLGNDGGVFRSDDGADTFRSLSGTLSLVQAYGIAAHPTDPASLFLGTQDNGMERRGADGKWLELVTGDYGSILFDGNNPEMLVTNYVEGLILAFANRGSIYFDTFATNATFGEEESGGRIAFIAPFEHSRATNTLYFGTWRLFKSTDFGRTWTAPAGTFDLTKGEGDTLGAIGFGVSDPNVIYTGSYQGQVMVSRNGGVQWTNATNGLPDRSVRSIAVDPTNADVAYIGFSGYAADHVWKTTNGGASWSKLDQGLPDIPVNALLLRNGFLYAGTDIGVFRLQNGTWSYFSNGMPPVIVTDFDVTASGVIVAATHGRGAYELVEQPGRRRTVRH